MIIRTVSQPTIPSTSKKRFIVKGVAIVEIAFAGISLGLLALFTLAGVCDPYFCGLTVLPSGAVSIPLLPGGILLILQRKGGLWLSYMGLGIVFIGSLVLTLMFAPFAILVAISGVMIAFLTIGRKYVSWKNPFIQID